MLKNEAVTSKQLIGKIENDGIDIRHFRSDGFSVFHFAAQRGLLGLCLYCINEGMDFCEENESMESPLSLAMKFEREEVVNLFKKWGAVNRSPEKFGIHRVAEESPVKLQDPIEIRRSHDIEIVQTNDEAIENLFLRMRENFRESRDQMPLCARDRELGSQTPFDDASIVSCNYESTTFAEGPKHNPP